MNAWQAFFSRRFWRHMATGHVRLRRLFPAATLAAIEAAVRTCEQEHAGEIRFAVESALHPRPLLHAVSARDRALEVFSFLRVWDTEHNNGILIYVLIADRAVEIVADRGAAGDRVDPGEWQAVCQRMETAFGRGDFTGGCVEGVRGVADVLARHPAGPRRECDELPDAPVILG